MGKWPSSCGFPLHHKSLIVSTKYLNKHEIKYKIVIQEPGDLICVRPCVYNQVINTGFTSAEAVNVGSAMWIRSATLFKNLFKFFFIFYFLYYILYI